MPITASDRFYPRRSLCYALSALRVVEMGMQAFIALESGARATG